MNSSRILRAQFRTMHNPVNNFVKTVEYELAFYLDYGSYRPLLYLISPPRHNSFATNHNGSLPRVISPAGGSECRCPSVRPQFECIKDK